VVTEFVPHSSRQLAVDLDWITCRAHGNRAGSLDPKRIQLNPSVCKFARLNSIVSVGFLARTSENSVGAGCGGLAGSKSEVALGLFHIPSGTSSQSIGGDGNTELRGHLERGIDYAAFIDHVAGLIPEGRCEVLLNSSISKAQNWIGSVGLVISNRSNSTPFVSMALDGYLSPSNSIA